MKIQIPPAIHNRLLCFVRAFLMLWALMLTAAIPVRSFLTPFLYVALILFSTYRKEHFPQASGRTVRITALLFTLMVTLAVYWDAAAGYESFLFRLITLFLLLIGWMLFFCDLFTCLFAVLHTGAEAILTDRNSSAGSRTGLRSAPVGAERTSTGRPAPPDGSHAGAGVAGFQGRHLLSVTFLACFLCYLPWYLYSFPGIFSPDPINQIEQVLGLVPLSNHHPVAHTAVIGLMYHFTGLFTQDITLRIGLYTLLQMTCFAFAAAFVVYTLRRTLRLRPLVCFLVFAFYAFLPFMAVFAVQVCKDTLFSAVAMLFCCMLVRFIYEGLPLQKEGDSAEGNASQETALSARRGLCDILSIVIFCILGVLLSLLRTNGWYAFLLFALCFAIIYRRKLKNVLCMILPVIILVLVIKGPVMDSCHVIQPDLAESLHIPMQQIAQVLVEHRELSAHDRGMIEAVIDTTYVDVLYIPGYADSFKELIRAGHPEVLEAHKGDYLLLWLRLGLRYPADYLKAWAAQIRGVTWPEAACDVAIIEGVYPNSFGLEYRPLIGGHIIVKIRELITRIGSFVPLYGLTWSMGAWCWLLLFSVAFLLYDSGAQSTQKGRLLILLPAAALFVTLLIATPIADEFRYAYPIITLAPFDLCAFIKKGAPRAPEGS